MKKILLTLILALGLSVMGFAQAEFPVHISSVDMAAAADCNEGNITVSTVDTTFYVCHLNSWIPLTVGKIFSRNVADGETITNTNAAGARGLYARLASGTNALTGDQIGVRGRSENRVNTMTGAIMGGYFQAVNYNASAGGTARGAYIETLTKGVNIGVARGLEVNVDTDNGETFGTELSAIYASVQTGSGETFSGTATVLRLANNGVAGGGGKDLKSFIKMDSESNAAGAEVLIDATAAKEHAEAGNVVCLWGFKDSAGTVRYLVFDADTNTVVRVNTSCT